MTGWDVLNNTMTALPPVLGVLLLAVAGIVFIVGFARYETNFIKCGFAQTSLSASFENRFDAMEAGFDKLTVGLDKLTVGFDNLKDDIRKLDAKLDSEINRIDTKLESRFSGLESRIDRIEVNHFGHLKSYLGVLNGILLDKGVIDNESKARLDNELRGM